MMLKHKSLVYIILILFALLLLSGCISKNSSVDMYSTQNNDNSITSIVNAPKRGYFDTEIEFDASESYDSDGQIVSYIWNFMDGETIEGKTVKHTFEFNDDYSTKFPFIYTVSLFIVDNDRNIKADIHHIMLYPKSYRFYLSSQELSSIKPMSHSEKIDSYKTFDLDFSKTLNYDISEAVSIPSSNWNLNLDIEKPFFSIVNKISISFFDGDNKKILEETQKLGFNQFWTNKKIALTGSIGKDIELKSISIELSGFRLKNILALYGSDEASSVTFNVV